MANKTEFFILRPIATSEKTAEGHTIYYTATGEPLKWSAKFELPEPGAQIRITMNSIGPAIVKGYFMEAGYLGVMTWALNPPAWLVKQRQRDLESPRAAKMPQWWRDGIGCEFGAEIDLK